MEEFRDIVWEFSRRYSRKLAWRDHPSPYAVLVSEVMLQQTQVSRVERSYPEFLLQFESFEALAASSTADLLGQWQGLGYNRRALWLRDSAAQIVHNFGGILPAETGLLSALPGVGPNTAGSIAAFAYNIPTVFIETNIRRVFIHHFNMFRPLILKDRKTVLAATLAEANTASDSSVLISDRMLLPLIELALDRRRPREWYYALMDYGADLVKRVPNPNRRSKHHVVQSKFEGSVRQLRGELLRQVIVGSRTLAQVSTDDPRASAVLDALVREGFLICSDGTFSIAK
jgi:A/G-specific adenine glycosylase